MGAAVAAFPAVALLFMLSLARQTAIRRNFGFMVAAVVVMFTMVRAFSYAIWLAIPMVAAGVVHMSAALRPGTLAVRALIALFLAPAVTAAAAMAAVQAMTARQVEAENSRVAARAEMLPGCYPGRADDAGDRNDVRGSSPAQRAAARAVGVSAAVTTIQPERAFLPIIASVF
jgi:hypothetical protein